MTDGQLTAAVDQYAQAADRNVAPPPVPSDPLVFGASPIEQLMRVLGLAANAGDPSDYTASLDGHAERDRLTTGAAEGFAAQDYNGASQLQATAQTIPALASGMASGIAGAVSGALSGVLQPLAQLPQQLTQGLTQGLAQAVQTGAIGPSDTAADGFDTIGATDVGDPIGEPLGFGGLADGSGGLGASAGGRPGGTVPAGPLGPPAIPSASTAPAATAPGPSRAPAAVVSAPVGAAGMTGVPLVPPGAATGTLTGDKAEPAATKRVSAPAVRNGAAVAGRLNVAAPVSAGPDAGPAGTPVAVHRAR